MSVSGFYGKFYFLTGITLKFTKNRIPHLKIIVFKIFNKMFYNKL